MTRLSLGMNEVGDEGADAFAATLPKCALAFLSLGANVSRRGALALARALAHCSSVEQLDLRGNLGQREFRPDQATSAFLHALSLNSTITSVLGVPGLDSLLTENCKRMSARKKAVSIFFV